MIINRNITLNVNKLNAMEHLTMIVDLRFALETKLNAVDIQSFKSLFKNIT